MQAIKKSARLFDAEFQSIFPLKPNRFEPGKGKISRQTKTRYKRKLNNMKVLYEKGNIEISKIQQTLASYNAHFSYGHTYKLQKNALKNFVLKRREVNE